MRDGLDPGALARAALPVAAIASLLVIPGLVILAAQSAGTLGFDFLAYHQAASRVLAGERLYDPTVQQTGGFGLFYYPPPFVLAVLPFALVPAATATWLWIGASMAMLVGGDRPPARRVDRPLGDAPARRPVVAGRLRPEARPGRPAAVPAVRDRLALARPAAGRRGGRRPRGDRQDPARPDPRLGAAHAPAAGGPPRRRDPRRGGRRGDRGPRRHRRLAGLRRPDPERQRPDHDAPQLHARRRGVPGRRPGGSRDARSSSLSSVLVVAAVILAALRAPADASLLVAIVASQLLSPVLWDHYAMLLLLPVAWLLERRQWWAVLIPLVTSAVTLVVSLPAVIYPVMFWISLLGVLAVGLREGRPTAATATAAGTPPPTASAPGPSPPGSSRLAGDGRRTRDAGRRPAPASASSTASTPRPGSASS